MKNWMDDCMNDYLAQKTYQKAVNPYKSIVEARKLCHCVHKELARLKSSNLKKIITKCEKTHIPKRKSRKRKSRKRKSRKRKSRKKKSRKRKSRGRRKR